MWVLRGPGGTRWPAGPHTILASNLLTSPFDAAADATSAPAPPRSASGTDHAVSPAIFAGCRCAMRRGDRHEALIGAEAARGAAHEARSCCRRRSDERGQRGERKRRTGDHSCWSRQGHLISWPRAFRWGERAVASWAPGGPWQRLNQGRQRTTAILYNGAGRPTIVKLVVASAELSAPRHLRPVIEDQPDLPLP